MTAMTHAIPSEQPWRRLLWELPGAILVCGLGVAAFTQFLRDPVQPPLPQKPIDARLIVLPPPPKPGPIHPVRKKVAKPLPKKIVKTPPPKEEKVVPVKAAPVALKPPPAAVPPPPPRAVPKPPPPQATTSTSPPGGGSMGARAIYQPAPQVPSALLGEDIDTTAMARFRVAADGTATVELVQATDEPRLNRAILDALRQWRFFPAMKDGTPVASVIEIRIPIRVQ